MKRRTDPNGEHGDWKIVVVAVNAEIESKRMFYAWLNNKKNKQFLQNFHKPII
jgi:hypothetical protein